MILGVTGSRDWTSRGIISAAFDELEHRKPDLERADAPMIVIEGGAGGADALCRIEALSRGWHVATMKALWEFYPRNSAGYIRNDAMIYLGMSAAWWLAFINPCIKKDCHYPQPHDSHGAAQCAAAARLAGIYVKEYRNG